MTVKEWTTVILCFVCLALYVWFKFEQWHRDKIIRYTSGYHAVKITLKRFFSRPRWGG